MHDPINKTVIHDRWLKPLSFIIIIAGILARLMVYLQNRDLIIDEANIARNVYERSFTGLIQPLSYEQYAPPLFLWITKLSSVILGFSEPALRLYPFLMGIIAFYFLYKTLKLLMDNRTAWYPLLLFAASPILIRYTSELKQYMPDVCITLVLFYLALTTKIDTDNKKRFALLWIPVGSVAVWASMPSVFILAGIGCYYGMDALKNKNHKNIPLLALICGAWMLQFLIYFLTILKSQIGSDYLQTFHQYDFLFLTPEHGGEWMHNWSVFNRLIKQFGNYNSIMHINAFFMVCSIIYLLWKDIPKAALFLVPLGALLLAAGLNHYSLLPRVALFSLPLLLLVIGIGFYQLTQVRHRWWQAAVLLTGMICAAYSIRYLAEDGIPFKYEQLTEGMRTVEKEQLPNTNVYLHHAAAPAYMYYTEIHPQQEKWRAYKNIAVLSWAVNYDSLSNELVQQKKNAAFIYTNVAKEELDGRRLNVQQHLQETKKMEYPYLKYYFYSFQKP